MVSFHPPRIGYLPGGNVLGGCFALAMCMDLMVRTSLCWSTSALLGKLEFCGGIWPAREGSFPPIDKRKGGGMEDGNQKSGDFFNQRLDGAKTL